MHNCLVRFQWPPYCGLEGGWFSATTSHSFWHGISIQVALLLSLQLYEDPHPSDSAAGSVNISVNLMKLFSVQVPSYLS